MTRYEHCISPSWPTVIWVRRKGGIEWTIYMRCSSAEKAAETLRLLQHPASVEVVTE